MQLAAPPLRYFRQRIIHLNDMFHAADMYEAIELLFGLDAGSISDAQLIYQLFFERTTAKPILYRSETDNTRNAKHIIRTITDLQDVVRYK